MRNYYDIHYCEKKDDAHLLDVHLPDEGDSFPVFIYFHGGGLVHFNQHFSITLWPEHLTDRGIAVVRANYSLYPDAKYPDFLEDAANVVLWVKEHFSEYANAEKIFVGGSSAGGYLSMMLCFDKTWLSGCGLSLDDISGFVHDAGQPSCHFNVLAEQGLDK